MKYFGQPEMSIIDYDKLKHVFVFDANGEYETHDEKIIEFMKKKKPFIKSVESEQFKCKKCGHVCINKGELMAHYRKDHQKEGE